MSSIIMSLLLLFALFFCFIGHSCATYCICKDGIGDAMLQKTIDYACGAGADCKAILQNGACFNPNTVKSHCDYAANSYFQNKGQSPMACDFSGTATPSASLPTTVTSGCSYPTSPGQSTSTGGMPTTTTGGTTTPGGTTTTGGTTSTGVPGSTTAGIYGGAGLAPTAGITDVGPNGNGSPSLARNQLLSLMLTPLFLILFL